MRNSYVTPVTDANFESVVASCDKPILLHFWSGWCFPCETLRPTIEALASKYKSRVMVGTVDAEENLNTAMRFAVWVLPTVLVLYQGKLIQRFQGRRGQLEYTRYLDSLLEAAPNGRNRRSERILITSQFNE